jgi:hypothetical protein
MTFQSTADAGGDFRWSVRFILSYAATNGLKNSAADHRVRERLKEVLRQYELRERHFECVIRSKELEVLLSRARAAEQKQLADGEKARAERAEEEVVPIFLLYPPSTSDCVSLQNQQLRKDLEASQSGQAMLIDKLIACCKEVCLALPRLAFSKINVACPAKRGAHATVVLVPSRRAGEAGGGQTHRWADGGMTLLCGAAGTEPFVFKERPQREYHPIKFKNKRLVVQLERLFTPMRLILLLIPLIQIWRTSCL